MTQRTGCDARAKIKILATTLVPNFGSLAADDGQGESPVALKNVLLCFFDGGHESLDWVISFFRANLEARRLIIAVIRRVGGQGQAGRSGRGEGESCQKSAALPGAFG